MNTIPVVEIFLSVQGEGPNIGARCIFVRVKGCSFACKWCDSKHTWYNHASEVKEYSSSELAEIMSSMCSEHNCNRLVLTGGNPCMYDFTDVIRRLPPAIKIDVETQGDLLPDWLSYADTIVFSPKAPSSGMRDTYSEITGYIENRLFGLQNVAIKIPVFSLEDIEFARNYAKWLKAYSSIHNRFVRLYLSVGNTDVTTTEAIRDRVLSDYEKLLNTINESPEDFENVFILPQLHTLVWGNKQGV